MQLVGWQPTNCMVLIAGVKREDRRVCISDYLSDRASDGRPDNWATSIFAQLKSILY